MVLPNQKETQMAIKVGGARVDGSRKRRQKSEARKKWYSQWRQRRFAKRMGFGN